LALVVTSLLKVFGVELELNDLVQKISAVVTAVFSLLALLGVVNDPTTAGASDSKRAMTYDKPWVDPITLDDAA
jgi:phi LC3 family holin